MTNAGPANRVRGALPTTLFTSGGDSYSPKTQSLQCASRMPRSLGNALPPRLALLFDGADVRARIGLTFLLLTRDETGWLKRDRATFEAGQS